MKKITLMAALLGATYFAQGQVGIGTPEPVTSSYLDVTATDKGILIPRVALRMTTEFSPITGEEAESLLVYNTATQNDVTPGFYYWYDNAWMRIVNASDIAALDQNTTNTSLTVDDGKLVLTDSDNNTVEIPLADINIPTTLVPGTDGTYVFTNEAGDTVTIDIPADVINNFEEIINNGDVLNEIIEQLGDTVVGGNVSYDGDNFTYVDENGDVQTITFEDLVQANETKTILRNNNDGTYTYFNEEAIDENGAPIEANGVTIDVPADVINNFEEIINGGDVLNEIIEQLGDTVVGGNVSYHIDETTGEGVFTYVDEDGEHTITFEDLVQDNETKTTIGRSENGADYAPVTADSKDTGKIVYEYLAEGDVKNYMDITADVLYSVENNEEIRNEIENIINAGGNVYYTGEDTTVNGTDIPAESLYSVDENGDVTIIPLGDMIVNAIIDATTEQINNIKNELGDVINNNDNSSVFTGDTYVDNGVTYYVYKGSFTTTINANKATTTGVTLDKAGEKIISLVVDYNNGLTSSVTDVALAGTGLSFNMGVGKRYEVISTSDIDATVIVEYASSVAPAGL